MPPRRIDPVKPVVTIPASLLPSATEEPIPSTITSVLTAPEFRDLQPFFCAQESFRTTPIRPSHSWMGSTQIDSFTRDESNPLFASLGLKSGETVPIFLKRIHILDPLRAVEGDYAWNSSAGLPTLRDQAKETFEKIHQPLNEAYVDALFALCANQMVATKTSPHWCQCFGTMTGRVQKYLYNITDELDEFERSSWWKPHQRMGLFRVVVEDEEEEVQTGSSVSQSARRVLGEATSLVGDEFEEVGYVSSASSSDEEEEIVAGDGGDTISEPSIALSVPRVRLKRLSDDSSETSTTTSEEGPQTFAEFPDFPVQITLLERADGTMDELLEADEIVEAEWTAWMFQVIAALTSAQKIYGFVHNDLHTNNIMWSATTKEHLIYKVQKAAGGTFYMKVPTFGKIMKIIDFGRASFTLPREHGGFYISDAFFKGNDAADQYNCAPFYDPDDGPKVEPNPSFDLCRLSVSLIEALYPTRPEPVKPIKVMYREGAKIYTETESPLYNLLWGWLVDKSGKNVLRSADGRERYPDFDLYKAIASDVKNAIPFRQIEQPLFASYRLETPPPPGFQVYDLFI